MASTEHNVVAPLAAPHLLMTPVPWGLLPPTMMVWRGHLQTLRPTALARRWAHCPSCATQPRATASAQRRPISQCDRRESWRHSKCGHTAAETRPPRATNCIVGVRTTPSVRVVVYQQHAPPHVPEFGHIRGRCVLRARSAGRCPPRVTTPIAAHMHARPWHTLAVARHTRQT